MKRILVPLFGLSLLLGTGSALADPPRHDNHGHDQHHDDRHDDRHDDKRHKDYRGHHWNRGERLPSDYRGAYVSDYHRHGLKAPPRGHEWRRVDDRYVLIAVATGLITSVILANH
ncbi:MAG TPA: RcnB family protein [Stenotrophomonas sp.]|nr:RcnB family protein [Stenotrophomonas sp.]